MEEWEGGVGQNQSIDLHSLVRAHGNARMYDLSSISVSVKFDIVSLTMVKNTNFGPKMFFFLVVVHFCIGVMCSCVKGAQLPPDTTC